jgi:hypothetical protein
MVKLITILSVLILMNCDLKKPCSVLDSSCNKMGYFIPDLIIKSKTSTSANNNTPANFTFTYPTKIPIMDQNFAITAINPTVTGTISNATFTVNLTLPAGLNISATGIITGSTTATFSTAVISNTNLLAWYKLDGNGTNAEGTTTRNLNIVGSPTPTTNRFGNSASALFFSTGMRLEQNDTTMGLPAGTTSRTLCS